MLVLAFWSVDIDPGVDTGTVANSDTGTNTEAYGGVDAGLYIDTNTNADSDIDANVGVNINADVDRDVDLDVDAEIDAK